jgi:NAD(P)H-quinone oxidoreductase subunit L
MDALLTTPYLVAGLYLALGGAYLLVIPGILYFYMNQRWYTASSPERLLMYGLVFVFFPGLLLLSPFLNFRPRKRSIPS